MRRTPLKRSGFKKKPTVPLKRTKLRVVGKSDTATIKKEIQKLLREIAILRDKKCMRCNLPYRPYSECGEVFQADHLLSRSHSATFACAELVVLVCRRCHAWKSLGSNFRKAEYDKEMRNKLSPKVVKLWNRCENESWKATKMDWNLELVALKSTLKKLQDEKAKI